MRVRILKQLALTALISTLVMDAYAVGRGLYIGVLAGPATNSAGTKQAQVSGPPLGTFSTTPVSSKSTQFGSRLMMGFMVNKYAGFEGGLNYFSNIAYDDKNVDTCSGLSTHVRDFDIMGKGSIPIGSSFDVFAKAGVAIVYMTASGPLNPDSSASCGKSTNTNQFKPAASIGASYEFSQNWLTDISWNRVMVGGLAGNVDIFGLGISYHFVDVYCGQFLC